MHDFCLLSKYLMIKLNRVLVCNGCIISKPQLTIMLSENKQQIDLVYYDGFQHYVHYEHLITK